MKASITRLFFLQILAMALAQKPQETDHFSEKNCIVMTPQKEKRLNEVVEKLTVFLNQIIADYQEFDIGFVNVEFEHFSDDNAEMKDTILKITVNDCAKVDELSRNGNVDENSTKANTTVTNKSDVIVNATDKLEPKPEPQNVMANNVTTASSATAFDIPNSRARPAFCERTAPPHDENDIPVFIDSNAKKPQVIQLNLPENGQELLGEFAKKTKQVKPLVVYVQEDGDKQNFIFMNRK